MATQTKITTKRCPGCKRRLPTTKFTRKSYGNRDGLQTECKRCMKARYYAWCAANPEKLAAKNARAYVKRKAERAAARAARLLAAKKKAGAK